MHYHLEIIMPPVENVEEAIAQILKPFNEYGTDEDGETNRHVFWDWYVIGGRMSGAKLETALDPEKKEAFFAELSNRKVTVSGVQCGKQTLQPASQIELVDALWNEYFPDAPVKICPFFSHFNNQYKNSYGFPDIMRLADIPQSLTAEHVIISGPSWRDDGSLEAKYMLQSSIWNGVNYAQAEWDGKVASAVEAHKGNLASYKPDYAAKYTPQGDWLVVTVDYHS